MADGHDVKADLIIYMQTLDFSGFRSLLASMKFPILEVRDHNFSNIFHEIAMLSLSESAEMRFIGMITSHCYRTYDENAEFNIKKLLNQQTAKEKLTPLMQAIQRNKIDLCKEFIKLGADPELTNWQSQNITHIAGACGYYQIMAYLKYDLDISLEKLDANGMSPLHLAVKEGRESLVPLLIAWGADINRKDNENNSLLHMSALSNNFKIARILLLKGISRDYINNMGQTAYDIAKPKGDKPLLKILVLSTQEHPNFLSKLNPFKPPLTPLQNSYYLFSIYVLLFIVRYMCVVIFMLPHFAIELIAISLVLFLINFMFFIVVHQKDPGFVKPKRGQNISRIYQNLHYDFFCPFCEIKKDLKTKHCHHCDRCVVEYDHHCPWIRNCVGKNNHSAFMMFLTFSCIDFLYTSVLGVLDYFQLLQKKRRYLEYKSYHEEFGIFVTVLCVICFLFAFPIWLVHIGNIIKKKTAKEGLDFTKSVNFNDGQLETSLRTSGNFT